jgi:chromosome segregation ATPase
MLAGTLIPPTAAAAEQAAIAPKVAELDAKLEKLGNELAAINRERMESGGRMPPKFDKVNAERLRLAHQRAALVQRLEELRIGEVRARQHTERLDARLQALDAELLKWGDPAAIARALEALAPVEDHIASQPGLEYYAHEIRRTRAALARPGELLAERDALLLKRAEFAA